MPDTPASATPSNSTGRGPGTVIVALYAVLALAALLAPLWTGLPSTLSLSAVGMVGAAVLAAVCLGIVLGRALGGRRGHDG